MSFCCSVKKYSKVALLQVVFRSCLIYQAKKPNELGNYIYEHSLGIIAYILANF